MRVAVNAADGSVKACRSARPHISIRTVIGASGFGSIGPVNAYRAAASTIGRTIGGIRPTIVIVRIRPTVSWVGLYGGTVIIVGCPPRLAIVGRVRCAACTARIGSATTASPRRAAGRRAGHMTATDLAICSRIVGVIACGAAGEAQNNRQSSDRQGNYAHCFKKHCGTRLIIQLRSIVIIIRNVNW